jgi:hypothetical protein
MNDWSNDETTEPLIADHRNFYKVERWTRDDLRVEAMLWAGNSIEKARAVFAEAVKHRPRGHYTIRQRSLVIQRWPL